MYYAGTAIGSLIIPRISDIKGRKSVTIVVLILNNLIYTGLVLS